jgi:hypothetical protein
MLCMYSNSSNTYSMYCTNYGVDCGPRQLDARHDTYCLLSTEWMFGTDPLPVFFSSVLALRCKQFQLPEFCSRKM